MAGKPYWNNEEERRQWILLLQQERRENKVKAGFCSSCCKRPKRPDGPLCQFCLDKQKNKRKANYAKGLCHCGSSRREGSKLCEIHYAKMKEVQKKKADAGICLRCDAPRYKQSSYCRVHLTINRKDTRQREGNQPWYPGCAGVVPLDSDEPDFELTNGDELFNG